MKRLFVFAFIIPFISTAQQVTKLSFRKGDVFEITSVTSNTITQQLMGKPVDIRTTAVILHTYEVKKSSASNTTFVHKIKRISISVIGMGDEKKIDTDSSHTMNGDFGTSFKNYLEQSFEITIDAAGNIIGVDKIKPDKESERPVLINRILNEMIEDIEAPKKGEASFFKTLPASINKKDNWKNSIIRDNSKQIADYTITDITEKYVLVDFKGETESETNSESGTTHLAGKYEGRITVDKETGIIIEETKFIESAGTAVAMGQSIPLKSKTLSTIKVRQK